MVSSYIHLNPARASLVRIGQERLKRYWWSPKADIGWTGNWGMAASSEDKDYVHLVTSALAQHTGSTPQIMVRNVADFERNYAT